jgi:hypothetical protein
MIEVPISSQRVEPPKFPEPVPKPIPTPAAAPAAAPSLPGIEESGVALFLNIIAAIELIAAPVAGIVVGQENTPVGWMIFLSGLIGGLILLGFARVVEHLYESAQRLRRIEIIIQKASDEEMPSNNKSLRPTAAASVS